MPASLTSNRNIFHDFPLFLFEDAIWLENAVWLFGCFSVWGMCILLHSSFGSSITVRFGRYMRFIYGLWQRYCSWASSFEWCWWWNDSTKTKWSGKKNKNSRKLLLCCTTLGWCQTVKSNLLIHKCIGSSSKEKSSLN